MEILVVILFLVIGAFWSIVLASFVGGAFLAWRNRRGKGLLRHGAIAVGYILLVVLSSPILGDLLQIGFNLVLFVGAIFLWRKWCGGLAPR